MPRTLQGLMSGLQSAGVFPAINSNTSAAFRQMGLSPMVNQGSYSMSWPKCQMDLMVLFNGIRTQARWAMSMLDASGKPGRSILLGNLKFMGNYIQCDEIHHRDTATFASVDGKICRATITSSLALPGAEATENKAARFAKIQWDICVPKSCTGLDLNKLLAQYNLTKSAYIHCTKELDLSDDTGAVISLIVLSVLGALVVFGTLLDLLIRASEKQWCRLYSQDAYSNGAVFLRKGSELRESTPSEDTGSTTPQIQSMQAMDTDEKTGICKDNGIHIINHPTMTCKTPERKKGDIPKDIATLFPKWQRALLAFSIPRNTGKILGVKAAPGSIGCLHGIRVMSMGWVILGHLIIFTFQYAKVTISTENQLTVFKCINTLSFQIIVNAPLSVDTFFLMSGLLTAYMFLKECGKHGCVTIRQGILYYVHRYWRLTPPLMIWIMIVANLIKYIGEGRPGWVDYNRAQNCRDNWWTNMLYINNVYRHDKACVGVTWFLAHDMQFYVVAPLALVPWAYGKRAAVLGFSMAAVFIGIHIASNIWLEIDINGNMLRNAAEFSEEIYFKPYARVAPFAIGLIMGWILWKTKCKVRMNKYAVIAGWCLSIAVIFTLTLVTYDENQYEDPKRFAEGWPKANRVAYETLKRPLWAAAIGWIVLACSSGYGGFINSILSWEGWLPMSRLTYCAYLVHLTIIMFEGITPETTFMFTTTTLTYHFLANLVMSYAVGYILAVTVEAPMLGLEKMVLS